MEAIFSSAIDWSQLYEYIFSTKPDAEASIMTSVHQHPDEHSTTCENCEYVHKKRTVDPSDPEQNTAALKIQTQFRQHSAKQEVTEMKEELAATRIQAGFRGYLDREEVRKMKKGSKDSLVDAGPHSSDGASLASSSMF